MGRPNDDGSDIRAHSDMRLPTDESPKGTSRGYYQPFVRKPLSPAIARHTFVPDLSAEHHSPARAQTRESSSNTYWCPSGPRQPSDASRAGLFGSSSAAGSPSRKINFQGFKDVPTGPRSTQEGFWGQGRPHIFISADHLPSKPATEKHLHKKVGRGILTLEIERDARGWYLCFPDTNEGLRELQDCFNVHNGKLIFSEYTLTMQRFLDGRSSDPAQLTTVAGAREPDTVAEVDRHSVSTSQTLGEHARNPTAAPPPFLPPLPFAPRPDDCASSLSGTTPSEVSAAKAMKCHVCKLGSHSESDALILCASDSCSRRYHRRCHPPPRIPTTLGSDHSWQCHRCIKKGAQLQHRQRPDTSFPISHSITDKLDLDLLPTRQRIRQPALNERNWIAPKESNLAGAVPALTTPGENLGRRAKELASNSDDVATDLAGELVEKSFSDPIPNIQRASTSSLKLLRHKIGPTSKTSTPVNDSDAPANSPNPGTFPNMAAAHGAECSAPQHQPILDSISTSLRGIVRATSRVEQTHVENEMDTTLPAARTEEVLESPEDISGPLKSLDGAGERTSPVRTRGPQKVRDSVLSSRPRTKPCIRCGRVIANTRFNKFCSRCKKQFADEPKHAAISHQELEAATLLASAEVPDDSRPSPSVVNTGTSITQGDTRVNADEHEGLPTAINVSAEAGEENLRSEDVSNRSMIPERAPLHTPSKELAWACDDCRTEQNKCTHTRPPDPARVISVSKSASADELDYSLESHSNEPDHEAANHPGGESLARASATPKKARQSHTVAAVDQYDLGNSFKRPKGTYMKLIGMALHSAPSHRLTSLQILQWVDQNIPNYSLNEGRDWMNGLRATLSMNRPRPLVRKVSTGTKKTDGQWELVAENHDSLPYWNDVEGRMESVPAPMQDAQPTDAETEDGFDSTVARAHQQTMPLQDGLDSSKASRVPRCGSKRRRSPASPDSSEYLRLYKRKRGSGHDLTASTPPIRASFDAIDTEMPEPTEQVGPLLGEDGGSTDEESLAHARRGTQATQGKPIRQQARSNGLPNHEHEDSMSAPSSPAPSARSYNGGIEAPPTESRKHLLAQLIRAEIGAFDYAQLPFFDEWPEHDDLLHGKFDRDARVAEINCRPTTKQRFGRAHDVSSYQNASTQTNRSGQCPRPRPPGRPEGEPNLQSNIGQAAYAWEQSETHEKKVDSFEELFHLPDEPMPIMMDGELAFRSVTRSANGDLPRARVVYKTGYA